MFIRDQFFVDGASAAPLRRGRKRCRAVEEFLEYKSLQLKG
jgi:hypothetical protein